MRVQTNVFRFFASYAGSFKDLNVRCMESIATTLCLYFKDVRAKIFHPIDFFQIFTAVR